MCFDAEERDVDSEYPDWIAPGHVVFERTGVEILATDFETDGQMKVLRDLNLQAQSPSGSEILEEDELLLSPEIKLAASNSRFSGRLEVRIPHGANMILSCPKWSIFLKELRNNEWKATNQTEENGIQKFVSESNHVRFLTDHLSKYVIVGKYDRSSPSMFKRMKIAAFCSETKGGEEIRMRIHFFDDCEWSYEVLFVFYSVFVNVVLIVCVLKWPRLVTIHLLQLVYLNGRNAANSCDFGAHFVERQARFQQTCLF